MQNRIYALAMMLGQNLIKRHWLCAVAESCTGGSLSAAITDCSGSSAWFDRGYITYSNLAKQQVLGVSIKTLQQFGAVSEETVREMAEGALKQSHTQLTVAISGIAGPNGGSAEKPVGTVWIAWASLVQPTRSIHCIFSGDRTAIREQSVYEALQGMIEISSA